MNNMFMLVTVWKNILGEYLPWPLIQKDIRIIEGIDSTLFLSYKNCYIDKSPIIKVLEINYQYVIIRAGDKICGRHGNKVLFLEQFLKKICHLWLMGLLQFYPSLRCSFSDESWDKYQKLILVQNFVDPRVLVWLNMRSISSGQVIRQYQKITDIVRYNVPSPAY